MNENQNINQFETLPMGRLITKMSLPIIISMLVQAFYNLVDSYFVAKISMDAITAVGIAFPIQLLMISVATGIGVGMNAAVAKLYGEKQNEKAAHLIGKAILLACFSSILFMAFSVLCGRSFCGINTTNAEILKDSTMYLLICGLGAAGLFFSILTQNLLQVSGYATFSMVAQVAGAVLNIVLDPFLILGYGPFPKLGVCGAAIATVSSQFLSAILGILFLAAQKAVVLKKKDFMTRGGIVEIIKIGFPAAVSLSMNSIMAFGMNLIFKGDTKDIAIFTIYYRLWCILDMPILGMLQGMIPIMGYNMGAKKWKRLQSGLSKSLLFAILYMVFGMVVFLVMPKQLLSLFMGNVDRNLMDYGVCVLRILSMSFVFCGIATVLSQIFQGLGDSVPGMVYAVLHQGILLFIPAVIISILSPGIAVWFAFLIAEILSLLIIAVFFRRKWKKIRNMC